MKAYLVYQQTDEGVVMLGAFSTREKASEWIADFNDFPLSIIYSGGIVLDDDDIAEIEYDVPFEDSRWHVRGRDQHG